LASLNLTSPWGRLHGQGDLSLSVPSRESTAQFTAEDLDLGRLSSTLNLPVRVSSTAGATVAARWPGLDFQSAAGIADVQLRAAGQFPTKNSIPVDATLHAKLQGNRVTLGIAGLGAAGATVAGNLALVDRKAFTGDVRIEAAHLSTTIAAAEQFLGKAPGSLAGTPVEGSLIATAKLAGTVAAPTAALNLTARDVSAGELQGIALDASARYTADRLSIDNAAVSWQKQTLHAAGTVGLKDPQPLHLSAQASDMSVASILAALNHADLPLAGNLRLEAEVDGSVAAPSASLHLAGAALHAYSEDLGGMEIRAQFAGRRLDVQELRLDKPQAGGNASLNASGSYDLDSRQYQFRARTQGVELSSLALPDGTPVRGALSLDASGQGSIDNPAGELKLTADRVLVAGREFGHLELAAHAANRQATLEAAAPKFNVTTTAKTGTAEPYPATVQIRLAESDLAQLPVQLDQPLEGTVSAVIDASGDLKDYERGTARAEVSQLNLKWNGELVRTEGPLVASFGNGTLTIDRATLLAAESRLEISGSLPLESATKQGDVQVNALLNLPGLAQLAPTMKMDLQGTAAIEGSIHGTLKRVDPNLTVSLDNGQLAQPGLTPAVTNAKLRGQVRDGAFEITSASASWGEASFEGSGVIPFALLPADLQVELPRRQGPARLTANLTGVNLAALEGAPNGLSGKVSARVEAEASRPELAAVKATLTFPELAARLDTYAITQDGTSQVVLDNGIVRVERLKLTGPATEIQLAGTAEVAGKQTLDLLLEGKLDASLAAALSDTVRARGPVEMHAAVTGSLADPRMKGFVQLADGQISMREPRVGIEGLNFRVDLEGNRATLSKLEGQVNGGTLTGQGSVALAGGTLKDTDLSLRADDLFMDFPAGLKTVSDVKLQLKSIENVLALRGSVLIKEGGFTDDLNFDKGILAAATTPRSLGLTEERNPLLDSMRFNISVVTQDPIAVQNNLAKAEISAQLVVLGSPYEMGLAGRLVIEEASELTLQERKYEVTRGIITFTSERSIEPNLDIEATTTASNYDITLTITGTPADTKTQLSSNPALPEPDIMAILITGKTLDEIRGQELQVAQNQMLSYLTGRLGSTLGRQVENATGLSHVRVEPNLIAAETNPGARLTVGQDISRKLQLVYSMDLINSSDQIYVAEYDVTKRFVSRGVRQSDGSFRFDFRHDLRFGGTAPEQHGRKPETRRIGALTITGQPYFSEPRILGTLKVKPGDRYDFFKLRKGLDRVNRLYTHEALLESVVRLRREQKGSTVNLNLKIDSGPKLEFVFEGASVPGSVAKEIRRVWYLGVFDTQRTEDAAAVLRAWLIDSHYLTPEVKPSIALPAPDRKHVVFEIQRGPRFEGVEWVFEGAAGLDAKRLRAVIESQKLSTEVYTKPSRVTELLTKYYHEMGFLDADVGEPRYELSAETRTGKVVFPVKEGPLYRVGKASFQGNTTLTAAELAEAVPLPQGEAYGPILRENALQRLRDAYWSRGYNEVETEAELQRLPAQGVVNLAFRITENARSVVADVIVEGNRDTSESLIRGQLEIHPGDPVNLQKIANSRRKLYNTGAFAVVDITREAVTTAAAVSADHSVRLRVRVQEIQPFELRYGGFYDTERGPGGIVDFSNRNSLGAARVLGFRGRYDAQLQE
ncbi:MAG TPA: translocation/assembly module TamB domain-containing protein, partial [Bryobacteraceae bacterium]